MPRIITSMRVTCLHRFKPLLASRPLLAYMTVRCCCERPENGVSSVLLLHRLRCDRVCELANAYIRTRVGGYEALCCYGSLMIGYIDRRLDLFSLTTT